MSNGRQRVKIVDYKTFSDIFSIVSQAIISFFDYQIIKI